MIKKRFTTVELPRPNEWGIWYDDDYLSTYQVCAFLNEFQDENEELREKLKEYKTTLKGQSDSIFQLKKENELLKQKLEKWVQ